jgi:hypothetical protein
MSDRDDCRRLLDTVLDVALAILKRALENLQAWRPPTTRPTPPEGMQCIFQTRFKCFRCEAN